MPRILRRLASLAAMTALALAATACAGGAPASSAPVASAADGAFPVTVSHVYGKTTIPEQPKRVVTIGWMTQDIVAALGTAPVGVSTSWGGDDEGFTPWFRHQVEEVLHADMPTVLAEGEEPDFEQILSLAPDLILAPHSGVTESQYARLSEIAPTIAFAERPWQSGTWQELTDVVATALGTTDRAAGLIADTQKGIDDAVAAHPGLKGASFVYGVTLSEGATEVGLYVSGDPRVRFLRGFGLVDSPSLESALSGLGPEDFYGAVSLEKLDTVDADVFVAWSSTPEETKATLTNPLFSRWKPIAEGRSYVLEDATMGMATNGPTLLSIPWAIENGFVDDLARAIDGDAVVRPSR
ncbi:iron complex transport system substrate-binding protein [Microbacterium resistens]|uniref:Iron complex transport system substrate-binding protein n=1 Tax=Microbacterium resistens TaxID=156977 RepID=A0ABU1SDT4_9MICO|nr:iron-siderophore ABC transporter substrate-binding protein [Microbacterium resistens]MDR6867770.1 iron complex transport system substrate-binding protein [Microbacterium resistens]